MRATHFYQYELDNAKGHPKTPGDALKKLQIYCDKKKLTLQLSGTDDVGRMIYTIKERPTFKVTLGPMPHSKNTF